MFLEDPGRSPFDLSFRLFDTPVRVHPSFWIGAIVFGWSEMRSGVQFLLIWVACVFLSVLVHEFGHVIMGRIFGRPGHILLYGMGGLAISHSGLRNRWQQIAVSLAGPGAGFLLMFAVLLPFVPTVGTEALLTPYRIINEGIDGINLHLEEYPPLFRKLIIDLIWINLIWGLFNLLPVWPLDGGMVCRELCLLGNPGSGLRISLIISLATAALLAINAIYPELSRSPQNPRPKGFIPLVPADIYIAIFMGILAAGSYMLLQAAPRGGGGHSYDDDRRDRVPWERDADWWKR